MVAQAPVARIGRLAFAFRPLFGIVELLVGVLQIGLLGVDAQALVFEVLEILQLGFLVCLLGFGLGAVFHGVEFFVQVHVVSFRWEWPGAS